MNSIPSVLGLVEPGSVGLFNERRYCCSTQNVACHNCTGDVFASMSGHLS